LPKSVGVVWLSIPLSSAFAIAAADGTMAEKLRVNIDSGADLKNTGGKCFGSFFGTVYLMLCRSVNEKRADIQMAIDPRGDLSARRSGGFGSRPPG
jgi:hypothetical protein